MSDLFSHLPYPEPVTNVGLVDAPDGGMDKGSRFTVGNLTRHNLQPAQVAVGGSESKVSAGPSAPTGPWHRREYVLAAPRACATCGTIFRPRQRTVERSGGRFCSVPCAASVPRPNTPHYCPESTRQERIRAAGLVNKRKKLGWFKPPAACMKCGAIKRLDSHHLDYSKPDEVLWLCRGCHRRAHTSPASIADLTPMKLDKRPPPPCVPPAQGWARQGSSGRGRP